MPEPELQTILDDVKTIKAILQNQDAPLPRVWHALYFGAVPAVVLIALLKFFVPGIAGLDFLWTVLCLWLPVLAAAGVVVAIIIGRDLKRTGTRFLAQGRVQAFFYSRLIVVPAVLTIAYLLSLHTGYSMDGAMMVLVSVGVSHVVLMVPGRFQAVPILYLTTGLVELALGYSGPWWTLANTLAVASGFARMAYLIQHDSPELPEAPRG